MSDVQEDLRPAAHAAISLPAADAATSLDVAIVGGGLAGLYASIACAAWASRSARYEAGSGVGGTWFWNRYPGARCDVESLEYSYSFSDELQQEWKWPERYGTQPEILRYINHVADRFDLRRDVQLEHARRRRRVFDRQGQRWTVQTDSGDVIRARYLRHGGGQSLDAAGARLQGPRRTSRASGTTPACGRTRASTSPACGSA